MEEKSAGKDSQSAEWGSDIMTRSTPIKKRRRFNATIIDSNEKEIIEKFEAGLEKSLTEKAAKSNLSNLAVKSILKYVVSDENVLALMQHKEKDENLSEFITFEPKITRSKAKQLSNSGSTLLQTLDNTIPNESQVQKLLADDLHEESSDDEYVPVEEESEDDSSFYTFSNPPTPQRVKQMQKDDDDVFKTPELIVKQEIQSGDEANIALRTRSKLCLNETPLEKIEQSFVPPDITNDMYEFECNDDDWKNFLNSFAQPLDEVVKNTEEEDLDPEYNILSDEEITKVDTEELRDDRAVRVPKRELNDLIAELFEYVDIYENRKDFQNDNLEINIDPDSYPIQQFELDRYIEIFDGASNKQMSLDLQENTPIFYSEEPLQDGVFVDPIEEQLSLRNLFSKVQLQLLQQQMCQHVQMLTQNFMLTFNHPCFSEYACEFKEYLLNYKLLAANGKSSVFNTINLEEALKLIEDWERKFEEKDEKALETIKHFEAVMERSIECFNKKMYYYLPIPDYILKTISESEVFIYPQLLPKIPFKHLKLQQFRFDTFSTSEFQLIALGLEQFLQFLSNDKEFMTSKKQISMRKIAEVIHKMLMPPRRIYQIYRNIQEKKLLKDPQNPISFYFKNKRAPFTVHQVIDLEQFGVLPPKKRPANLLPRQWRSYIYQTGSREEESYQAIKSCVLSIPPKKRELKKPNAYRKIVPKSSPTKPGGEVESTEESHHPTIKFKNDAIRNLCGKQKFLRCFHKPVPFVKYVYLIKNIRFLSKYFPHQDFTSDLYKNGYLSSLGMLPSMPCIDLLAALSKDDLEECGIEPFGREGADNQELDKEPNGVVKNESTNKEHIEDMNSLLGSSTVKNVKKEQTLMDKRKAKKRREYVASLAMLAPPIPAAEKERKSQFSTEYMKKLKQTLNPKEFDDLLKIFASQSGADAVDFYRKLKPILVPKYQDLADEFLLFLTLEQASAVGELIPFFIMNHMVKFLRYLELYFKDQPTQLRRVYKSLQDLNDTPGVNLERIKSSILPLLKSNPLLCDSFLQLFLEESPTTTLLNGAWDVIDVNKELNRAKEDGAFEIISVTEEDPACSCNCHKTDGDQPQKHHCNNCGLKFIQGKIYCQTSKGMKPVNVSFPLDPDVDHNARLSVPNKIRKVEPNSNKSSNIANKESGSDNQTYIENDSDGRKRKVRVCKSRRKTSPKQKVFLKKDKSVGNSKGNEEKSICKSPAKKKLANPKVVTQPNEEIQGNTTPITGGDWKNLPSPEFINVPLSDSDSSQEEERTLTNNVEEPETNTDGSTFIKEDVKIEKTKLEEDSVNEDLTERWTREEDRILLETYKQNFNKDPISLIKQRLQNRTEEEIRSRFDHLMTLLQEMYSKGNSKLSNY